MKTNLLFVLLAGFMPFIVFSQKIDVSSGVLYVPAGDGDRVLCIDLNYYRNLSSKSSIGISVGFGQYFEEYEEYIGNEYGEKDYSSILSLIYKNRFYNKNRSSLYYGAGIAFGSLITYYEIIPVVGYCGVGLPENWEPPTIKRLNHWNYEYLAGITTSLDYQYRIVDDFYMGANLKVGVFYYFEDNMFFPGIIPLVKIGYKW